jgi:hypothetical protein
VFVIRPVPAFVNQSRVVRNESLERDGLASDRRPVRSFYGRPVLSKDRRSFLRIMRWRAWCNPNSAR